MKLLYIALIALVLTSGLLWMTSDSSQSSLQEPSTENSYLVPESETIDALTDEVPGSDVGMELPIADVVVDTELPTTEAPQTKVFEVAGENFSFNLKEIHVTKGDVVTINFISTEGFHDWVLDEFSARTEKVQTGNSSKVTFVADEVGTFEYYCSVGSHRASGMVGTLVVK
ncbi:MAG: cupredoxin domain-containing protein [Candidatus Pacebacteria bacterium]|nr:cupredoxin domain-containing protein [Candidatus Paceibacterota bacterium]MCF7857341.1 cupredoxin domain-containing protein [Candidatus Paceibacterota bacterium]